MRRTLTRAAGPAAAVIVALALTLAAGCGTRHGTATGASQGGGGSASNSPQSTASPTPSPTPSPSCGTPSAPVGGGPGKPTLNAVQFVSASDGWVVGSGRILHTTDGGVHWVTQYSTSPKAGLATVDFIDAGHGWVVGAATVLATSDGGAHWRALPEPCQPIRAVHFFSESSGVAVAAGGLPSLGVPSGGGGILLATSDGGQSWRPMPSPRDVQTACFTDSLHGWLGAGGNIYGTSDGGRTWTLAVRRQHPAGGSPGYAVTAQVECAGPTAAWGLLIGPGAAMSHEPQIGYHTFGSAWRPIFAEQYFPHPGLPVKAEAPGVYPGPFSAISPAQAVYIGYCAPCSMPGAPQLQGTAPMDVALNGGAVLLARGPIPHLSQANGAAFVSADNGWVVGTQTRYPLSGGRTRTVSRIMHTADGGRSWQVQYVLAP